VSDIHPPGLDLVVQASTLDPEAIPAFRVAVLANGVTVERGGCAARLHDVRDDADTRRAVAALSTYWRCDAALVPSALRLAQFRVLALDMDSTLITIECIDEVAALAGHGAAVAAITAAAMRGEITDYAESLRRRVALLAGASTGILERVYRERLQLSDGAQALLTRARAAGLATLLVSGGFTYFTDRLRERLGLDRVVANEIGIDGDRLDGSVSGPQGGPILDGAGKAAAVTALYDALGCGTDAAVVIGDGSNDIPMMAIAGLSVAYKAKPRVQAAATVALNQSGLDGVIRLFADG